ncbi:hypothetical protein BKA70DRAFT_1219922 [Coprinopsis sp. MPI-PUGE-AT-0042]|nr:hypothetical protein BKA70DRAFT_1219922 [Coprinopsis sp. MPI-PUGE-AT-0042]
MPNSLQGLSNVLLHASYEKHHQLRPKLILSDMIEMHGLSRTVRNAEDGGGTSPESKPVDMAKKQALVTALWSLGQTLKVEDGPTLCDFAIVHNENGVIISWRPYKFPGLTSTDEGQLLLDTSAKSGAFTTEYEARGWIWLPSLGQLTVFGFRGSLEDGQASAKVRKHCRTNMQPQIPKNSAQSIGTSVRAAVVTGQLGVGGWFPCLGTKREGRKVSAARLQQVGVIALGGEEGEAHESSFQNRGRDEVQAIAGGLSVWQAHENRGLHPCSFVSSNSPTGVQECPTLLFIRLLPVRQPLVFGEFLDMTKMNTAYRISLSNTLLIATAVATALPARQFLKDFVFALPE